MFHRTGGTSSLHSESFVINEHQSQFGQSNNNGLYGGVDNRSMPFTQKELELAAHSIGVSPSDFRAVGPARLFRSGSTHQQDCWNYTGYHGVVAVLVKPGVNAVFLVLVDTPTGVAILSQQCHSGFEYHVLSQTMHAFEGDDAIYGLQFPDNFDSLSFANTVKGLIQALQQQRSMMNQGFLSSTQPIQQQIGSPPQSFLSSAEYINQPITNSPMMNYSSPSYGTTSPPQTSTQAQATTLSPPPSYLQNAQRSSLELGEPRRRNTLTSKFRNLFRRDQHQYPQQQQTPATQPKVSGPSQFVHSAHVGPTSIAPDYHRQQAFSPSNITTSTESVLPPMPYNIQQQLLPPSTMNQVGPIDRQVSQSIIVNREAPADVHSPPVVRPPAPTTTIPSNIATTGISTCNPPPPPPPMMNQQKIKMPQVGDNSKKASTTTDKKASVTETVSSMKKEEPVPGFVDMQADILKELMKRREKKSNAVEPNGTVSKKNEQTQEKPTAASLPKKQQPSTVVKPVERELPESVKRQSIRKKAPPPPPPRSRNSIVTEEVQQQTTAKSLPPVETPSSVQRGEGPVIQQPITIETQLPVFPPQVTVESVDSDKVSGEKHVPIDLLAEIRRPHALKHVTDQEKAKTPTVEDEGHDMMSALKNKITGIRIAMGEDDEDFDDDFN